MDERIKSTDDVLAASHIIIRNGEFPTRIVLREEKRRNGSGQFITHKERLKGSEYDDNSHSCGFVHAGFDHGGYYNYGPHTGFTREEAFEDAKRDFKERTAALGRLFGD